MTRKETGMVKAVRKPKRQVSEALQEELDWLKYNPRYKFLPRAWLDALQGSGDPTEANILMLNDLATHINDGKKKYHELKISECWLWKGRYHEPSQTPYYGLVKFWQYDEET